MQHAQIFQRLSVWVDKHGYGLKPWEQYGFEHHRLWIGMRTILNDVELGKECLKDPELLNKPASSANRTAYQLCLEIKNILDARSEGLPRMCAAMERYMSELEETCDVLVTKCNHGRWSAQMSILIKSSPYNEAALARLPLLLVTMAELGYIRVATQDRLISSYYITSKAFEY